MALLAFRAGTYAAINYAKYVEITPMRRNTHKFKRYIQYGLYHDDMLCESNPGVTEAIRRLPKYLQDERAWRLTRSLDLNAKKDILPKDQWTTFERDMTDGRYLQAYLWEVRQELEELNDWNSR
jgi:hypothetical protein